MIPARRCDVEVGALVLGPAGYAYVTAPMGGTDPIPVVEPDARDVIAMFAAVGLTAEIIHETETT